MTSYAVVNFFEDESVEGLPSFWMKKNNSSCAWPKNRLSVAKSIKRKRIPNEIESNYFKQEFKKTFLGIVL